MYTSKGAYLCFVAARYIQGVEGGATAQSLLAAIVAQKSNSQHLPLTAGGSGPDTFRFQVRMQLALWRSCTHIAVCDRAPVKPVRSVHMCKADTAHRHCHSHLLISPCNQAFALACKVTRRLPLAHWELAAEPA